VEAPSIKPPQTLADALYPLGIFAPILFLLAIALTVWLIILFVRIRPLSEHIAYIAATLYPFLLGILGGTLGVVHWVKILGNQGIADPGYSYPALLAQTIGEILLRVIGGTALTCLFFPLGILALLIRKPK